MGEHQHCDHGHDHHHAHRHGHDLKELILRKDGKFSRYLSNKLKRKVQVKDIAVLGEGVHGEAYRITTTDGSTFVLKRFKETGRNLQFPEDRIRETYLSQRTSNLLPNHVKVHDVMVISSDGNDVVSLPPFNPLFLMEEANGRDYFADLDEIAKRKELTDIDSERLSTICKSLAEIHDIKGDPAIYHRYLQDWFGNGILDLCRELHGVYPDPVIKELKEQFLEYQHRLEKLNHRCKAIHGEFFPGTIRFDGIHLVLYDNRRFGYGEPADDYGSFVFNLALTSILNHGKLKEPFLGMIKSFIGEYQVRVNDRDMDWVILPFMAYRALIVANPKLVPLAKKDSARVLRMARILLRQKTFKPDQLAKIL